MGDREAVRYLRRAFGVAAFIVALGPPVGFLAYMVPLSLYSAVVDGASVEGLKAVPKMLAIGVLFSFMIGGVPALMSAVPSALLVWRHGTLSYVQAAVFALAAGVVSVIGLQFSSYPDVVWRSGLGMMAFIGGLSVVSALVCRWGMG
ncbi:MAG: hypothetical protein ABL901_19700, partial [Hyphomicrobiaceae bacterium]